MFTYYLRLAVKSMRRTPAITALMVAAIGVGIAMCTVSLTVYHLMSANPMEKRNDVLFAVTLDSWDPERPWDDKHPQLAPTELTYRDVNAILAQGKADRTAVMRKAGFTLESGPGNKPFLVTARLTTGDFFPMFDVPFQYGGGWDSKSDRDALPVVVLSKKTNDTAFGGQNSIGRTIKLDSREFRVVGVLKDWQPTPKFYDLNNGNYDLIEDVYAPFALGAQLQLMPAGNVNCWKPEELTGFEQFLNSECIWNQAWVELRTPQRQAEFKQFLDGYVAHQKTLGRFPRPMNNHLYTVKQWLAVNEVVDKDNRVLMGLAFMFLAVCVLNVVGLLLAKFLGGSKVTALRRALGASRGELFKQHLVEVGAIGFAGGVLGLLLGALGLLGLRRLYENYDQLTHMDLSVALLALLISVAAGALAGLYPAWRVCRVAPSTYLRT
jgi:putative ABC transport system permease protein